MFFTARIVPAPVAAGRSAAGFTATFMVIYLGATSQSSGGRYGPPTPVLFSRSALAVAQGDVVFLGVLFRGILDQLADHLRIVRRQPVLGDDLELASVPLHHVEFAGTFVIPAGQLVCRDHAFNAELLAFRVARVVERFVAVAEFRPGDRLSDLVVHLLRILHRLDEVDRRDDPAIVVDRAYAGRVLHVALACASAVQDLIHVG